MKNHIISQEDWLRLYEAAAQFKETKCWEWMYDTDLFGVQDPVTGQMGYCCVLGNAGEVFGLNVYLGDEGVKSYFDLLYQKVPQEDMLFVQNCLTAHFEDRDILDKYDISIIRQLGLRFRGRNQWPQFRNYTAGYMPWYLNVEEVRFLTLALEQAVNVVKRCKENDHLLEAQDEWTILVREPMEQDGSIAWHDEYVDIEFEEQEDVFHEYDEMTLKRLSSIKLTRAGDWEIDFFHISTAVAEGERPYYPVVFAVADADNGIILHMKITNDLSEYIQEFQNELLHYMLEHQVKPRILVVQREEAMQAFEDIAKKLNIQMEPAEELPMIKDFRLGLEGFMDSNM